MKILSMLRGMPPLYLKLDLKMKLTVYLFIISLFQVQASSYAQNTKITLHLENVSVEKVLREIESNTQFKFLYNDNEIEYAKKVSISVKNKRISKILEELFSKTPITYEVFKKQIILKRALAKTNESKTEKIREPITSKWCQGLSRTLTETHCQGSMFWWMEQPMVRRLTLTVIIR